MPHMGSQVPGVHLRIRQRAKLIRGAMPLKEPTMAAISNAKNETSNAARAAKHAANQAARAAKNAKKAAATMFAEARGGPRGS